MNIKIRLLGTSFVMVAMLTQVVGCSTAGDSLPPQNDPPDSPTDTVSELNFKLKTHKDPLTLSSAEEGVSILFGTLGVFAYYYRPGMPGQMGTGSHDGYSVWESENWSRWQMLGLNTDGGRDFLLTKSDEVNLRERAGDRFYNDVSEEYVDSEGVFSMDVIEVNGNFSLINSNNQVCGPGYLAVMQPSDFPSLDFFSNCRSRHLKSSHDNSHIFAQRLFFVRKDWFPTPVQIYRHSSIGSRTQCYSSDVALSSFQVELIDDLMGNVEKGEFPPGLYSASGCPQNVVNGINIIPQEDDVAVIQFKKHKNHVLPTVTPNGRPIPTPAQTLFGQNIELTLAFNVLPSSFVDFTSFNDSSATSDILIKRSDSGAVWGASIGFQVVTPAIVND